jgi:soluble lytic murein transglycosylase
LKPRQQRPWTFYGQLAEAQLGRESTLSFEPPRVESDTLSRFLDRFPAARRAAALAQLGRLSEVESELRRLHADLTPQDDSTFLALAIALEAPAAQLRAAEYGSRAEAAGFCPTTTFAPEDGFSLDRALIYAIVRQESYFNPKAVSVSNARGLMQLLPSTARDMDRSSQLSPRARAAVRARPQHAPRPRATCTWLMTEFHNDGDLGRVFAAYNGGPGWLSRWLATQPADLDPLLRARNHAARGKPRLRRALALAPDALPQTLRPTDARDGSPCRWRPRTLQPAGWSRRAALISASPARPDLHQGNNAPSCRRSRQALQRGDTCPRS